MKKVGEILASPAPSGVEVRSARNGSSAEANGKGGNRKKLEEDRGYAPRRP
jgi:hypothetical protein